MTHIGPYGGLIEIRSPKAPLPVNHHRPESSAVLLGGGMVAQRAPRASREWRWQFGPRDVPALQTLFALEDGVYGPPPWRWYDTVASRLNLLPSTVAACGMGPAPWRWLAPNAAALTAGGPVALPDGQRLAYRITPTTALTVPYRQGVADPVPVLPGRVYTASGHPTATGTVGLAWCDASGAVIATDAGEPATGRAWATATAPVDAAGVLVTLSTGTAWAGLQLTETPGPVAWQRGMGVPRVTMTGLSEQYRLVTSDVILRDASVTLVEVA